MRKTLLRSLPIIARALGDQLGVEVVIGGNRACTDGKTIVLPALPEDDGACETLARGYIDHEAGHVRFTDMSVAGATPVEHGLTNAIEDLRMEGLMEARYPGCRTNLDRLVNHLVQDGSISPPGTDSHPANILQRYVWVEGSYRFLDRPGLEPVAKATAEVFGQTFPKGVTVRIRALMGKILSLESTAESLALAKRILKSMEEPEEPEELEEGSEDSGESQPGTEGGSPPDETEEPEEGSEDSGESQPETEGTSSPDVTEGPEEGSEEKAEAAKRVAGATEEDLTKGIGEIVAENLAQATMEKERSTGNPGVMVAGYSGAPRTISRIPDMAKVRQASAGIRAKLAGLVQAIRLERRRLGRVGRLDTHHLTRILTGDPRIFRGKERIVKHDTAVSILLDRSGSMKTRMEMAVESALAVTIALAGIPKTEVEVSAFPGGNPREVYRLKSFGSKADPAEFGITADGGTPMTEALWLVASRLVHRPETRKLCFVVTDGVPADKDSTKSILAKMEREGIECIGVGIGNPKIYSLFPSAVYIEHIKDLAPTLFSLLRKRLVNKTAA
jgi:Mg-chelatase subunit ChlD